MLAASDFNRIAPIYDALAGAVFGGALLRAQRWAVTHGLPPTARRILFVGGGTGRVLPAVLAQAPEARVTYVEASAAMLTRARAHLARTAAPGELARVEFLVGTDADLSPVAEFDAVLTFFFLDLFNPADLATVMARLSATLAPGATWLVADFAPPRTAWQRGLLTVMYRFFRLTANLRTRALPDWPAALTAAGWRPVAGQAFVGGAVRADGWRRA